MKSKSKKEMLPFFVYGTLLPGQPNAALWGNSVMKVEKAMLIGGRLYDMGSYPMLVEEGSDRVVGVVSYVAESDYETVLAQLDHLEGYDSTQPSEFGYQRVVREVQLSNGSTENGRNGRFQRAWVYIGQPATVRSLYPIPGGDWAAYTAETFQDKETWWQDEDSVHGLFEPPEVDE